MKDGIKIGQGIVTVIICLIAIFTCITLIIIEIKDDVIKSDKEAQLIVDLLIKDIAAKPNLTQEEDMNWFEQLGRAVAQEAGLTEGNEIEHQCGTVWVTDKEGTVTAISGMETEGENE